MSWMRLIVDIVSFIFEGYIISIFFNALSAGTSIKKGYRLLVFYIIFVIVTSLLYYLVSNVWIRSAFIFIFIFLLSCLYKINIVRRIVGSLVLFIFLYLCELFVGFLLSAILKMTVNAAREDIVYYSVGVLVSKSITLLGVKIFQYKYHTGDIQVTKLFVIAVSLFPITTFVVGVVLIGGIGDELDSIFSIAGACAIILLTIANVVVFFIFENYAKQQKIKSNLELDQVKLQLESEYLSDIIQKQMQSSKAMHDLKNQLFAIKELVKRGDTKGLKKIEEICDTVSAIQNIIYTNDTEVDAVINSKAHTASIDRISLSCRCYFSGFGKIDKIDLCVLIGNLLDNAIESCKKIETERFIEMNILQRANMVNIIVVNPYIGEINYKDGVYNTSKGDKYAHGFGLKSVKSIVNKYDGDIKITSEKNLFTVSILLPSD